MTFNIELLHKYFMNLQVGRLSTTVFVASCSCETGSRRLYKDRHYKTVMNNHETTLYLMHVNYCGLEICTLSDLYLYLLILTVCWVLSLLCNWPQTNN